MSNPGDNKAEAGSVVNIHGRELSPLDDDTRRGLLHDRD